jgi:hypothetical protein
VEKAQLFKGTFQTTRALGQMLPESPRAPAVSQSQAINVTFGTALDSPLGLEDCRVLSQFLETPSDMAIATIE